MFRTALCGLVVAVTPALASAQLFRPAGGSPQGSPFGPMTPYANQPYMGVRVNTMYGPAVIGQPIPFNNPYNRVTNQPFYNWFVARPSPPPAVPWAAGGNVSHGYMSGGSTNANIMRAAQQELDRAQRDAANRARFGGNAAKPAIDEEWNYEKFGAAGGNVLPGGIKAVANNADELIKALSITDESELLSGQALTQILQAVATAEGKGAKGPSTFLPPQVLAEVRFAGPAAADAINFLLEGSKLVFPVAFDDPKLKEVREELDKDYTAVATALREGKLPEINKLKTLAFSIQRAQVAIGPVVSDHPFDDAVAARRFLNRLDAAQPAFNAQNSFLLFSPAWLSEGASVGDLVKHMTKFKLQFGQATDAGGESYLAIHKGISTYLFVLTQPKK